jgi:hypothetical protein
VCSCVSKPKRVDSNQTNKTSSCCSSTQDYLRCQLFDLRLKMKRFEEAAVAFVRVSDEDRYARGVFFPPALRPRMTHWSLSCCVVSGICCLIAQTPRTIGPVRHNVLGRVFCDVHRVVSLGGLSSGGQRGPKFTRSSRGVVSKIGVSGIGPHTHRRRFPRTRNFVPYLASVLGCPARSSQRCVEHTHESTRVELIDKIVSLSFLYVSFVSLFQRHNTC